LAYSHTVNMELPMGLMTCMRQQTQLSSWFNFWTFGQ